MSLYKEVREKLKLTQEEMAEQIGVTPKTLQLWETKEEKPSQQIRAIFYRLKNKIQILEKIKNAAGKPELQSDFSEYINELKEEVKQFQISTMPTPHEEVLITHLTYAIDDYFRKKDKSEYCANKEELALHIYKNIKFLF